MFTSLIAESFSARLRKAQKASPLVYAKLNTGKSIPPTQTRHKWVVDCDIKDDEYIKWPETYQLASKCSTSTRLVEFQFKLLHRRLSTNDFLAKIGVQDNPNCSFCEEDLVILRHLFWSCSRVTSFWNSLFQRLTLAQIILENYKINITTALGLIPDSSKNHR